MSFLRYPEYKDSRIPWLGEVPSHWEVERFKWLIDRNDGGVWGDDPDGVQDTVVLRSTEQTVEGRWRIGDPATRKLSARERLSALLVEGDLLLTKSSGSALHIGKTTLVDKDVAALNACYSNFMQRIRVQSRLSPKIAWYLLNNGLARVQLDLLSNSTTGLANLNGEMIGELIIPAAPEIEQVAISNFLDRETAKIDALIAGQETLLALLAEKRQAAISHAVTRGLDPDVPMKDSGIAWLGEVPAHWGVVPLKSMVDPVRPIMYGIVLPGPDMSDGIPILKGGNVKPSRMNLESMARTTEEIEAPYARARLRAGDLVYAIRGTIGDCEMVPDVMEGVNITQDVARIAVADSDVAGWVRWALLSSPVREELAVGSLGAAVRGVNIIDLKRVKVPRPSFAEQAAIAEAIDAQVSKFDQLSREAKRVITLLQERRSALIAAAVTGQIDVRGVAA